MSDQQHIIMPAKQQEPLGIDYQEYSRSRPKRETQVIGPRWYPPSTVIGPLRSQPAPTGVVLEILEDFVLVASSRGIRMESPGRTLQLVTFGRLQALGLPYVEPEWPNGRLSTLDAIAAVCIAEARHAHRRRKA